MEKFPTPDNNHENVERVEKSEVLKMLKENGMGHAETMELVIKWTTQREAEVEVENSAKAALLFDIERTDLYLEASDVGGALDHLDGCLQQAEQLGDLDLYEQIKQKIDKLEPIE